jgi:hypothetical protein
MDKLGATEDQLDFPVIYASALNGWAATRGGEVGTDMRPLFDAVLKHVPEPQGRPRRPLQLQISAVDYSSFLGPHRRRAHPPRHASRRPQEVAIMAGDKFVRKGEIGVIHTFQGLDKVETDTASVGEIVSVTGIEDFVIGTTYLRPLRAGRPADGRRGRADAHDEFPGEHLAATRARKASTSPAATSATASTRSCSPTWRCASRTPTTPTSSASRAAASCTSRS